MPLDRGDLSPAREMFDSASNFVERSQCRDRSRSVAFPGKVEDDDADSGRHEYQFRTGLNTLLVSTGNNWPAHANTG